MNRFCVWCMYEIGPLRVGVSVSPRRENFEEWTSEWNRAACSMVCARKMITAHGGIILWIHEEVDGRPATAYSHPS